MEIDSLTDWIIALANVVMAGAATYAAFKAKDWFTVKKNDYAIKHLVDYHQLLIKLNIDFVILSTCLNSKYSDDNQSKIEKAIERICIKISELINIKNYASAFSYEINDNGVLRDAISIVENSQSFIGEAFRKASQPLGQGLIEARNSVATIAKHTLLEKADSDILKVKPLILHLSEKIESLKIADMLTK